MCRSLNLSRNRIGIDVLVPLLHELRFCDSLEILDLSWNAINHRCVKALCEVLIPRDRTEKDIQEEKSVEEQNMTMPLWTYNRTLSSLSLAGNRVGYLGVISLNRVLSTHPCLKELNLFHSSLDASGGKEISKSLRHNTVLEKLNLRFNNITQDGADAIANSLSENVTLKELNLADNHFGRLGVLKLYHGLKKSRGFLDIARTLGYNPEEPTKIRVRMRK
jgi:NLR family CARD domain-containing protein 3